VFDAAPSQSSPAGHYGVPVRLVELDRVTGDDWQQIVAGEPEPFGAVGETLVWRDKTHHVGVRDDAGQLVAMAGLVLADVRVADEPPMQVAGIGGVIVTKAARGQGLARMMVERVIDIAGQLEVERAMLFCLPQNTGLYAKFGFQPIERPVWAQQPGGLIEVPMRAMFKPLAGAAGWPEGRVELLGEPF
jgi:predicted GNAT family N-acyltransferase